MNPGDRVGAWRIERELGRGAMAIVYLVRHESAGVARALKVLETLDAEVVARTRREARVQARLRHPNVVRVHEILDVDGRPGLLMDYVAGPNLHQWRVGRAFSHGETLDLFRDVVGGVAAAHRAGLVHRDLKPDNVLVDPDGRGLVTDFGLVKVLEGDTPGQTRTGATMGTPGFMAPEQIRRARHADQRADVFALGCVLYWLYAQQPPFVGESSMAVMQATIAGRYLPLGMLVDGAPPGISDAITGALQHDPEQRIPDCSTLLAVIEGRARWEPRPATSSSADTLSSMLVDDSGPLTISFGPDGLPVRPDEGEE